MNHVIIGTAGHVDHGKTSLIKALTGIDTDRLTEEKKRGITIELGFAHLELPNGMTAGVVDVPGHEKFIRHMLAGAGGVDIAMLIIAADEGVMPQTEEHLSILSLLNISKGVIALTKCDMVDEDWVELVREDIAQRLEGTFLSDAKIIPVSAYTGQGLDDLRIELARLAESAEGKDLSADFRLPADRVFTMGGFGTVITGTLLEGTLREGDEITLYPAGIKTRARSVQVHSKDVKEAYGGQRVAVNLAGIKKEEVLRGFVAAAPDSMPVSLMADVRLTALKESGRVIKNNSRLHFYHGANEILAKAVLLDRDELQPGESCFAQLRFEEQVASKRGDRFVLRFYSPLETVGGGEILDPDPLKHKRNDAEVLKGLEIKQSGDKREIIRQIIAERSHQWLPFAQIAVPSGVPAKETEGLARELCESGRIVEVSRGLYLGEEYVKQVRRDMLALLTKYHKENPLKAGMKREELRTRLLPQVRLADVDGLINHLIAAGAVKEQGGMISVASFKIEAGEEVMRMMERIEGMYRTGGFAPPATEEVPAAFPGKKNVAQILSAMLAEGTLVRLDEQIYMHREFYDKGLELALDLIDKNGQMTLAEFRDATGTSRKYALALLEYFDRVKLTKKVGDARVRA